MRKIFTLFLCLSTVLSLCAETLKVTGSVLDSKTNEPLIGVSVLEIGTTNGIITDLDGNFSIQVTDGSKLQLSYIGYHTIEMRVTRRGDLGIIMMDPEAVALEDVTITGQIARNQKTPVAVSQVTALDIDERLRPRWRLG